jgi:tetratricopeptide (TPR) repeat protein
LNNKFSKSYFKRGEIYYYNKNDKKALSDFKKALKLDSGNSKILQYIGKTCFHLGLYEEAVNAFEEAIKFEYYEKDILWCRKQIRFIKRNYLKK